MTNDPYLKILLALQVVAAFGLLARMAASNLLSRYCWFAIYLALEAERLVMLWPLGRGGYSWAWIYSQPLWLLSFTLAVFELYRVILANYRGLASAGRWFLMGSSLLALLAAGLLTLYTPAPGPAAYPMLRLVMHSSQTVCFALLFSLLLVLAFLVYFPVELSRNTVMHAFLFTALFLCRSVALFTLNSGGEAMRASVNVITMGVAVICLMLWTLLWNRQGEERAVVVGHRWDSGDAAQAIRQLNAINASLLRAARQ